MTTDVDAVRAANDSFYAALEDGDLDALERLWADHAVCVHPGMAPIHGRKAVLRSWAAILAAMPYLQFVITDVVVATSNGVAVVTCTENLLSAAEGMPDTVFAGGHAVATNVYRYDRDAWRLWVHHASGVRSRMDWPGQRRHRSGS
ncbi:MAG: nuclear transport factor 2 family protein [Jiangellaceae bacterium]|nr:nuclear transport factor 2 family protein [Jiangellaceae bacterium]